MKIIAKAAGLDKATIYHYFETKEELYNTVLEDALNTFIALTSKGFDHDTDPGDELTEFVSVLIDFLDKHRSFALILRREFSSPGMARGRFLKQALAPLIHQVRKYIEDSVLKGEMRRVNSEHVLYSVYEILFGYFTMNRNIASLFFEEKPYSKQMLERRKEHITMVIRRLLVPEEMMGGIK
jgi:AcrR family transcriptional regulator